MVLVGRTAAAPPALLDQYLDVIARLDVICCHPWAVHKRCREMGAAAPGVREKQ
jgi:hypothetical protein